MTNFEFYVTIFSPIALVALVLAVWNLIEAIKS